MVMWIALGAVALGLIVLVWAVASLFGRLGRLRRAALKLRRHQARAEALQAALLGLQERVEPLIAQAEKAQAQLAVIQAKRS
ncbi:hypothetical protein WEI85_45055 [Actinomycetes bacterium KLBMP 9797]